MNEIILNNDKKQSQEMGAIIEIIQNIKRLCQEKGAIIEEKNPKYHNIISGDGGNVGGCWK